MSAIRWFMLDPPREVSHVDRCGFVEMADAHAFFAPGGPSDQDNYAQSPLYKTARFRNALHSSTEIPAVLYADRDATEADYEAIDRLLVSGAPPG